MGVMAIHPGEHLAEELKEFGMSAAELARRLDVPTNRITEIRPPHRTEEGGEIYSPAPNPEACRTSTCVGSGKQACFTWAALSAWTVEPTVSVGPRQPSFRQVTRQPKLSPSGIIAAFGRFLTAMFCFMLLHCCNGSK